jgi:hypothetical protein
MVDHVVTNIISIMFGLAIVIVIGRALYQWIKEDWDD